jgi:glutathione S-transferase
LRQITKGSSLMIEVHYWPTANGKKVTILLEELAVPYTIVPVNIGRGDQFKDDFLAFSPNNRIPAIIDTDRSAVALRSVYSSPEPSSST